MEKSNVDKSRTSYPWMEGITPEFKRNHFKIRSREGFVLLLILLPTIILNLIGIIEPELYFMTNSISNIYLLCILLYIFCGVLIPLIWILAKVALRTKNRNFVFQSVFYIQYLTLELFFAAFVLLPFDTIFDLYYSLTNQLSLPDEIAGPLPMYIGMGYLTIFLVSWASIKQPLFLDNFNNIAYQESSTILSSQALDIVSEQDGYSQRNLFLKFDVLSKIITDSKDFHSFGVEYSKFLGKKGVIIDWEVTDNSIKLYPRFLMNWPRLLNDPLIVIRVLNNVRKRQNLTVIEISFNSSQISIQISHTDYDILAREVTFHLLSEKVLEKVKQSVLAFLDNDKIVSYDVLFGNT